ncbi:hypothetical protein P7C73_g3195, partial [Tremellales sp. Uapishka_1]
MSVDNMSATSTLAETTPVSSHSKQPVKDASAFSKKKRPWRPFVTPFEDIVNHRYQGAGTEEDPYLVDWMPKDQEDPQKWAAWYKWTTIFIVSIATLAVALASSAYSGGIVEQIEEFHSNEELMTAGVSLFVVGFAAGPLLWAPLSEIFGRRPVYIISYIFLTIWCAAGAGAQSVAQVLVFRFLAGLFGSSPLANAGGTVADVLNMNQRGLGMALFASAPFLGPALGPITGGFLGSAAGWRWIEGMLAIFCGVVCICISLFTAESYAPRLLRQRATTLSKATGKVYRFRGDAKAKLDPKALFHSSLVRPWKFLFLEPIVLLLTIYVAIVYGTLYLSFASYPIIFEQLKGFNAGEEGLAFLGVLVGVLLAVLISVTFVNPAYIKISKTRKPTPEDRLPPSIWGGVLIVIGLGGFAGVDGPSIHWIAPILFGIPFGCGMVTVFLSVLVYLVDSYTIYAASVLAANSVLRSLFGAAFPLFTRQMYVAYQLAAWCSTDFTSARYARLGIHWAASIPAFLALACIPFTVVFYKYGASIRAKCKYAADAERQMNAIIASRMAANAKQPDENTDVEKQEAAGMAEVDDNPRRRDLDGQATTENTEEYQEYVELARRDEVDLEDDERVRLESLHQKYENAERKRERRASMASRRSSFARQHHVAAGANTIPLGKEVV